MDEHVTMIAHGQVKAKRRPTVTTRAIVDALERIVFAGVALTTRSLSEARADLDLTLAQWRVLVEIPQLPA